MSRLVNGSLNVHVHVHVQFVVTVKGCFVFIIIENEVYNLTSKCSCMCSL